MTVVIRDDDTATRTVWGEAEGEPEEGQIAVAWVIRNRAEWKPPAWWGTDVLSVCHCRLQFSCMNPGTLRHAKIEMLDDTDPMYRSIRQLVEGVFNGEISDPTFGCTQYKVTGTKASWDRAVDGHDPVVIGKHSFWRLSPSGVVLPLVHPFSEGEG